MYIHNLKTSVQNIQRLKSKKFQVTLSSAREVFFFYLAMFPYLMFLNYIISITILIFNYICLGVMLWV